MPPDCRIAPERLLHNAGGIAAAAIVAATAATFIIGAERAGKLGGVQHIRIIVSRRRIHRWQ